MGTVENSLAAVRQNGTAERILRFPRNRSGARLALHGQLRRLGLADDSTGPDSLLDSDYSGSSATTRQSLWYVH